MKINAYTKEGLWKSKEITEEQALEMLISLDLCSTIRKAFCSNGKTSKTLNLNSLITRQCPSSRPYGKLLSISTELAKKGWNMDGTKIKMHPKDLCFNFNLGFIRCSSQCASCSFYAGKPDPLASIGLS
jgi:hypothetical protein